MLWRMPCLFAALAAWSMIWPVRAPADEGNSPNIAAFARVVSYDPQRMAGSRAGRIEEFPAEDVFLGCELSPGADGSYVVPAMAGRVGCIGLEWWERRPLRQVSLEFADPRLAPPAGKVQVQCWNGISPWQGAWQPWGRSPGKAGATYTWRRSDRDADSGTEKIRWIFPPSEKPIVVKRLSALSGDAWGTTGVRIEAEQPAAGKTARISMYNGVICDPPPGGSPLGCSWDMAAPLVLKVMFSDPKPYKGDRTLLRFELPNTALSVAVEDLLAGDGVYVPHAGLFVTRDPAALTLDAYRKRIAGRKTVLSQVRALPDQTFAQAIAKVHHPIQDLGPMMLSLACDNRKFLVDREGAVAFDLYQRPDDSPCAIPKQCQLAARFGDGQRQRFSRGLDGGWLPVHVTTTLDQGIVYRQRTCVVPFDLEAPAGARHGSAIARWAWPSIGSKTRRPPRPTPRWASSCC